MGRGWKKEAGGGRGGGGGHHAEGKSGGAATCLGAGGAGGADRAEGKVGGADKCQAQVDARGRPSQGPMVALTPPTELQRGVVALAATGRRESSPRPTQIGRTGEGWKEPLQIGPNGGCRTALPDGM